MVAAATESPAATDAPTPAAAAATNSTTRVDRNELSQHNVSGTDCWVAYYNTVYDLTTYVHPDPPGNSVISCGLDGTVNFAAVHPKQYLSMVDALIVGEWNNGTVVDESTTSNSSTLEPTGPAVDSDGEVPTTSTDEPSSSSSEFITLQELHEHSMAEDCWVSYYGDVYAMTEYAPTHPAGPVLVYAVCGWDGTAAYAEYHEQSLLKTVHQYFIGTMEPGTVFVDETTQTPRTMTVISIQELARHNSPKDCWVAYYDDVYDLTNYMHPGKYGNSVIYMSCGQEGTRNFTAVHPRDYLEEVEDMKVGWLEKSAATTTRTSICIALLLASFAYSTVAVAW